MREEGKSPRANTARWWAIVYVSAVLLVLGSSERLRAADPEAESQTDPDATHFVVVFPGGPAPSSSGQQVIGDFLNLFSDGLGQPVAGNYFNDAGAAVKFLEDHPNSFVMGSTGFFLANRKDLNLVPLASVALPDGQQEQYFVVVKAGQAASLDDLRGKTLAGQPLYESPRFLNRIVFAGQLDVTADLETKPTGRPLSALRNLLRGDIDGVLLNPIQYASLEALPFADDLETIFKSSPVTAVGFCMRDSESNQKLKDGMMEALSRLSKTDEGREACKTFGIAGFEAVKAAEIDKLIEAHDAND